MSNYNKPKNKYTFLLICFGLLCIGAIIWLKLVGDKRTSSGRDIPVAPQDSSNAVVVPDTSIDAGTLSSSPDSFDAAPTVLEKIAARLLRLATKTAIWPVWTMAQPIRLKLLTMNPIVLRRSTSVQPTCAVIAKAMPKVLKTEVKVGSLISLLTIDAECTCC